MGELHSGTQAAGVSCWGRSESGVDDGGGVVGSSAVWQVMMEMYLNLNMLVNVTNSLRTRCSS